MLVTGAGTTGNLAQARALGASSVVVKPFATAELVAAVETALSEAVTPVARPGRSVLLVEDDADLAGLVSETISRTVDDVRVVHALDIASAVRLSAESSWSLAVLDNNLPDGSGLDLLERLLDSWSPRCRCSS